MGKNKLEELINYLNSNVDFNESDHPDYGKVYFINKKIKQKKKNVLLVSHEMKNTGAPIVLLDMGISLKKIGYNVFVVSLEDGVLVESFIKNGMPVIISDIMKKYQLSKVINKNVTFFLDDIINNFNFSVFNTITLFNYIKRYDGSDNKIIWWIHEGTTILDIPELKELYPKELHDNIHVYCVSEYCKQLMDDRELNYNSNLLYYGVKKANNNLFVRSKKVQEKKFFLCIGTITHRKGQKVLIDAIKSMPPEINSNLEYIFIGKANEDDEYGMSVLNEIKELADKENFVNYYESMSHNDVLNLYNQVDALIVPSFDDPMPVVATECMMKKRNVICSDSTGTASLFNKLDNSFVFKTGDYLDLVDKIVLFHKNNDIVKNNRKIGYNIYKSSFKYSIFSKNIKRIVNDIER